MDSWCLDQRDGAASWSSPLHAAAWADAGSGRSRSSRSETTSRWSALILSVGAGGRSTTILLSREPLPRWETCAKLRAARALLAGETNAHKVGRSRKRKKSAARAKMAEALS
jgi:hypothetical protein